MLFKNVYEYFKKCIWISCLYVYKCTAYIPNAQRGQERVLNPSELNPGPLQLFLTTGPFLQPRCLCFFYPKRFYLFILRVLMCIFVCVGGRRLREYMHMYGCVHAMTHSCSQKSTSGALAFHLVWGKSLFTLHAPGWLACELQDFSISTSHHAVE